MADDSDKLSGAEEYSTFALLAREVDARKILLCYDPARTSQKKLLELIRQAGGQLAHIESEGSPLLGTIFPVPPPAA